MTTPIDDQEDQDALQARRNRGDSDSGEAGAGSGLSRMLTTKRVQQVKGDHRHLMANDLIEAIVEFFSELPMRASANLSVRWERTKTNVKSFAIVNWVLEAGEKLVKEFGHNRQRTPDTRSLNQKKPPNFGMSPGPTGPNGQ